MAAYVADESEAPFLPLRPGSFRAILTESDLDDFE